MAGASPILRRPDLGLPVLVLLDHREGGRDERLTRRRGLGAGSVEEGRGADVPAAASGPPLALAGLLPPARPAVCPSAGRASPRRSSS